MMEICEFNIIKKIKQTAPLGLAVVAYYVLYQLFYNMVAYDTLLPYDNLRMLALACVLNITPIIVLAVATWQIVYRRPSTNIKRKMLIDAMLCIAMLVAYNLLYPPVMRLMGLGQYGGVDWAGTAFNAVLIYLAVEVSYYVRNYRVQLTQAEEQKRLALQYQYDALKAQVNPHFLFNSLNILYSLVSRDQQQSQQFIVSLSQMYRYVLAHQNQERIPLNDEMEFLQSYIEVLKMHYHDSLEVIVTGQEHVKKQEIIPFTLQLLLENVTKHNIISPRHCMQVRIDVAPGLVTMTNPIRAKKSVTTSRIGLQYVGKLYQLHGREFVTSNDGSTFTAIAPCL